MPVAAVTAGIVGWRLHNRHYFTEGPLLLYERNPCDPLTFPSQNDLSSGPKMVDHPPPVPLLVSPEAALNARPRPPTLHIINRHVTTKKKASVFFPSLFVFRFFSIASCNPPPPPHVFWGENYCSTV